LRTPALNLKSVSARRALTAAVLALLPVIYFYPAITGDLHLAPGDGWTQNFGVRALIGQMLRQGQLPLWNPYIFAGTPLLASIYPGALYPPNWLFAVFPPGVAMKIVVITTYHLALIGTYLYARRIGINRTGAVISGMAFTFGGYMLTHLGHTSRIAAAAWLPWIMLAIEGLYQAGSWRTRWRWVTLGAIFVALELFAGEPQMTFYIVLVGGAYGLLTATWRAVGKQRWHFVAGTGALAVCGLLLSMIQLLPERELLQQGERAKIGYEYFSLYSLPPSHVLTLIFPYFFGGAAAPPYKVDYWGEWSLSEACCYVGALTLLLGLVAVFGRKPKTAQSAAALPSDHSQLVIFWAGVALLASVLAFGDYLPFGLNYLLYRIPVYNLFRASNRHLLEITFALSVLAGLGLSSLRQIPPEEVRRALLPSTFLTTVIVVGSVVVYHFFGQSLATLTPRPANAGNLTNPDLLIPLTAFVLSIALLWFYAHQRTTFSGILLIALLITDLAAFGHSFEWAVGPFNADARLADPPTVKYLRERDPEPCNFRVVSHGRSPFEINSDLLNYPNAAIPRGIQSVNGYDALRLMRPAALAGDMTIDGIITDWSVFNSRHQGFNLLNTRYLLIEGRSHLRPGEGIIREGIPFAEAYWDLRLRPGVIAEITTDGAFATELACISNLGNATHLAQGTPVAWVRLYTKDGRVIERELQAGRDTSEWAWDRADVRAAARHQRARVAESWDAGEIQGHRYFSRLTFERSQVDRVEIEYALQPPATGPAVAALISRASLYDSVTNTSVALDGMPLAKDRWRRLESFGPVDLYENLKALPRAWFVPHLEVMPGAEVLRSIKEGKLKDGRPFDPAETALLETEDFGGRTINLPPTGEISHASVRVTKYEPQRIELATQNPQPGFLVLSEIYYRGWEAWIDGNRTPVERVNYALRGIAVLPGEHKIEFVFRSPSFRAGLNLTVAGAAMLIIGAVISRMRYRQKPSAHSA